MGAELYVTPSDKRLSLEVEVANENAAHHRAECIKRGNELHTLRNRNRRLIDLLQKMLNGGAVSAEGYRAKIRLELDKELG
ncbi:hypothetical protein D3C81_1696640 [compost metagenome]